MAGPAAPENGPPPPLARTRTAPTRTPLVDDAEPGWNVVLMCRRHPRSQHPTGFTLIELVVVLIVLALAAALAAPSLRQPAPRESGLASLIIGSREAAARRGETIRLTISSSGSWVMEGAASAGEGPLQSGRLDPFPGLPLTLNVSPVGTCGFDARSASNAAVIRLDPLTCTLLD